MAQHLRYYNEEFHKYFSILPYIDALLAITMGAG